MTRDPVRVLGVSSTLYTLEVDGARVDVPRVTTILGIIDKSRPLMGWAVKMEREAMRVAVEDVMTNPAVDHADPGAVYTALMQRIGGAAAHVRKREEAANIGNQAHRLVEWHTKRMLGQAVGVEQPVSDAALRAVVTWLDWTRAVDFEPQLAEYTVACLACGFAGTADWVGKITAPADWPRVGGQRIVVCGDLKTGKAVYPEAFLQNVAYRHGLAREGIATEAGVILRLPKTEVDPHFEAVLVPPMGYGYFLSASRLWRWQRMMDREPGGTVMRKCAGDAGDGLTWPQ